MNLKAVSVRPEQLLLDPNNYRFHDLDGYRPVINRRRYADAQVQARALGLLQSTPEFGLQALKDSILTNGFVPLEQVVVEEYDTSNGKRRYLVVEGNRRIAAIRSLLNEIQSSSITVPADIVDTFRKFRAFELQGTEDERTAFKQVLMAIRHVAGIREWGPYQQAKLVAEMYEKGQHQFSTVAQAIGMRANEVARRYRAIKALGQMENDDEFGEYASPKLYAAFQEAISSPLVRDWLGWSDETYRAESAENRRNFYELLIPQTVDGETYPPKLRDVRQVRKLKDIVNKPLATSILLDPEKGLEEAMSASATEDADSIPGILEHSIGQAIQSLNKPGIDAWLNPTDKEKQLWGKLLSIVEKIKGIIHENNEA
jgi:hypothetical protein